MKHSARGAAVLRVLAELLLLAPVVASTASAVRGGVAAGSPVERVVDLLKDLKDKLQQDGTTEQQVYDKYACWCEKTTARKAEAIEGAKNDLRSLGQEILKQKGLVASLATEIEETAVDIKENEEAQREATAIRQKENAAYLAETSELKQAIAALEKAVTVLRDASAAPAALLQRRSAGGATARASEVFAALQDAIGQAPASAFRKLRERSAAHANLVLLRSYGEQLARHGAKYTPQSATITGILDNMYSTFSEDLQSKTSEEASKNQAFEDFMATKQTELIELQDKLKKAEADKAEAELMLAEATQSYDDTEAQLKADIAFFDTTKTACQDKTDEWQARRTLREEEIQGISKALEILTSDEARQLFAKAIKPGAQSFLQLASVEEGAAPPAKWAYQALKKQATKTHSLRLARLAAAIRTAKVGHFDAVLLAIDKMVQELNDEEKEDIAKRDQCLEEYQKVNSTVADLKWKIEVSEATIAKLDKEIEKREDEKAETIEQLAEVEKHIEAMSVTRKAENEAFLQGKKDDEDAIKLLTEAKAALADFYANNSIDVGPIEGAGLLQQGPEFERSQDAAPDAKFSEKGKRKGQAKGVLSILTMIIEDLGGEISNAMQDEEAAQLDYEKQLDAAKALKTTLETKRTNLESTIAERKEEKTEENTKLTENQGNLEGEEKYRGDIQKDCDWVIGAFAERRDKRTAEVDGLTQAKAFLAGYQESAAAAADAALLLQGGRPTPKPFDDEAFGRLTFDSLASPTEQRRPIARHAHV